jgi:hypothetical protein
MTDNSIAPQPGQETTQPGKGTTPEPAAPPADQKTAGDPKPGDGKQPEAKPDGDQSKKVVPESYDLKLSEDSYLNAKSLEQVTDFAKKNGLSNEEAQAIVDRENERIATYVDEQSNQWQKDWEADKEIGGAEFKKNVELAKRVVDRFGDADLKKGLERFGYGNHPALGRMLVKIGKAMAEDSLVIPGAAPKEPERKSTAEIFYSPNKE